MVGKSAMRLYFREQTWKRTGKIITALKLSIACSVFGLSFVRCHENASLCMVSPKSLYTQQCPIQKLRVHRCRNTSTIPLSAPTPRVNARNTAGKLTSQKFLKAQRDIPIPIIIILLKHIRHPFQNDTTLHKQIETHRPISTLIVRRVQEIDEGGGEPIAEGHERFSVFVQGDVAAAVFIEAVEEGAPGGEEAP